MTTPQIPPIPQPHPYKLTTKNLFKHFLLVHDFLYKFTKTNAPDPKFLDTQIDVQNIMNKATQRGGQFGQLAGFGALVVYCLRANSIPVKFVAGFLYVYWINHIYTMGQYMGALVRMPKAYKRIGDYFLTSNPVHPNLLDNFQTLMSTTPDYDDTHQLLQQVFPETTPSNSENSFTTNTYFVKNKEKYNLPSDNQMASKKYKLKYLDSFLTRYVYYSFMRWEHRVELFLGIAKQ